jgi:DNA-binding LacI/PurR family transcriptional regulator
MQKSSVPTIKDVARHAGVSIATVSYVLNNKPAAVSEETRRRVLQAVEQLGYTRNITARNLRSSKTRLLGYAWMETANPRPNAVLEHFAFHLAREASHAGYHLLTFTFPHDNPLPVYDQLLRTGRVDAFILASTVRDDVRVRYLLDQGFPFVTFGRANPEWDFNWVDTDNHAGTYKATQHLLTLGHERIAIVTWPEDSLTGNIRLAGYQDALRDAGIQVNPAYIIRREYGEAVGEVVFEQLGELPPHERPTAVVTVSDMTAISVMSEAEHRGLEIGKTLSVIGYDDETLSQYLRPALTSVRQPIQAISYETVAILDDTLNQGPAETRQLLIAPELIVRESTGRPIDP